MDEMLVSRERYHEYSCIYDTATVAGLSRDFIYNNARTIRAICLMRGVMSESSHSEIC